MKPTLPRYLIANVNKLEAKGRTYTPETILGVLLERRLWQLNEKAANRKALQPGDLLVFYVGGPKRRHFIGTAEVASEVRELADADKGLFDGESLPFIDLAFDLKKVRLWKKPKPAAELLESLSFIEPRLRQYWGLYFRQALRQISKEDYETIVKGKS